MLKNITNLLFSVSDKGEKMYTYHVTFYFTSGAITSYSVCFDEEQDPDELANEIVAAKFIHWVKDNKLTIVNLANIAQVVVTGPL